MDSLNSFRAATRDWLEANCPEEMRDRSQDEDEMCWDGRNWTFQSEAQRLWLERMGTKGWTVPTWSKEYGGGGLSNDEDKILKEELNRINARSPLQSLGAWMLGPAPLKHGTHEQKNTFCPLSSPLFMGHSVGRFLARAGACLKHDAV